MPRRELFKTRALPDVPFAENLVFYAPLTEGDLTDHISGTSPTTGAAGTSVTWNTGKGMYLFAFDETASVWTGAAAVYNNPAVLSNIQALCGDEQPCALVIQCEIIAQYGNRYGEFTACYDSQSHRSRLDLCSQRLNGYAENDSYVIYPTGFNKLAIVYEAGKRRSYVNGTLGKEMDWVQGTLNLDGVYIALKLSNNYRLQCYVKDIRIYNRSFTAQEVAQL